MMDRRGFIKIVGAWLLIPIVGIKVKAQAKAKTPDYLTVSFTHDELYEVMQKKEAPLKLRRTV